jgi:hypothetical protein
MTVDPAPHLAASGVIVSVSITCGQDGQTSGKAEASECGDGTSVMVWAYEDLVVFAGCVQCQSDVRGRVDNAPKIRTGAVF